MVRPQQQQGSTRIENRCITAFSALTVREVFRG